MIKLNENIRLYNSDCLEILKTLPDNKISSCVTDPPYGLSNHDPEDIIKCLGAWIEGKEFVTNKKGFMGKTWDSWVPGPELWKEVYRVLKPGGYILCFAGSRTQDLMGMSLRLAGFEIRDIVQWLYGQGFPKSMDISKAIDKQKGLEREVVGKTVGKGGENLNSISRENGNDSENAKGCGAYGQGAKQINIEINITAANSDEAKQWEGWGTALKPAYEPIILARKPVEGTVADNVLKYGVGGLNIDGSRIELSDKGEDPRLGGKGTWSSDKMAKNVYEGGYSGKDVGSSVKGRFPANIILDEEAGKILDEQSGITKSTGGQKSLGAFRNGEIYGSGTDRREKGNPGIGDIGGASRFFYCPKTSQKERNEGLENFTPIKVNDGRETEIDNPFQRGETLRKNTHPTVKPIALMKYLIKLITPKNGIIIDPFNGSGSTGCAIADLNNESDINLKYIGIELEKEYVDISENRINYYIKKEI